MTVSTTGNRAVYSGNGSTTAFSFPYPFRAFTDLVVTLDGVTKTYAVNYTVTGTSDGNGGYSSGLVAMTSAPANGVAVVIVRDTAKTQNVSFQANDPFPASSANAGLDTNTLISQDLSAKVDRSIRVPSYDSALSDLPDAATRASKFVAFDSSGALTVTSGTGATGPTGPTGPSGTSGFSAYMIALNTSAASETALKTSIHLLPGTDVQAYNANLTSLAGLTLAANKLPYATGASTLALADFTAAGRALVDDADAAAQRTTLGLGTMATQGAGAVAITGGSITGLGSPSASTDAATKGYVDGVAVGFQQKTAVACATTANITLSGEQTIDGVLTSASRVLVKNQTTTANNGIYTSGAGAWTRTTDADAWAELVNAGVFVSGGTVNASSGWICNVAGGGVIGVTSVTWVQNSASLAYTNGTGLQLVGGQFSIDGTVATLTAPQNLSSKTLVNVTFSGTVTGLTSSNVGLGNVANVDTSNASNISSGTLSDSRLPTTMSGKTLPGATIVSPTGLVKGDVGLGNVPNVDATNASNLATGTMADARTTFTFTGTGAVARTLQTKIRNFGIDAADYGAVYDGTTDSTNALQNAINAASAAGGGVVWITGPLKITSTILLKNFVHLAGGPGPGVKGLVSITYAGTSNMFDATALSTSGASCTFENLFLQHTGTAGRVIQFADTSFNKVIGCTISGTSAGNTDPLIDSRGGVNLVDGCNFNNARTNAYCWRISTQTGCFMNTIRDTYAAGAGNGLWITSDAPNAHYPEGTVFSNFLSALSGGVGILIESASNTMITNCTLDQGTGIGIWMKPIGTIGISDVQIHGGYFSSVGAATTGTAIKIENNSTYPINDVRIHAAQISFAGYGIVGDTKLTGLVVDSCLLSGIANTDITLTGCAGTKLLNSRSASIGNNMILSDGSTGSYYIAGWQFDTVATAPAFTITTPSNFVYGDGNTPAKYGVPTTPYFTVAGLANITNKVKGMRANVTDSNATLTAGIGAVVAGGGANFVPVSWDGTNWRIG